MSREVFPKNYNEWKICITQKCKIPLTIDFVKTRINSLSDESSEEREKFIQVYGVEWTAIILRYFQRALKEDVI